MDTSLEKFLEQLNELMGNCRRVEIEKDGDGVEVTVHYWRPDPDFETSHFHVTGASVPKAIARALKVSSETPQGKWLDLDGLGISELADDTEDNVS